MTETILEKALALGMTEDEFHQVCKILGREPTDTELAMFSVEWSEHCGYGRSKQWLKLLPQNVGKYRTTIGSDAGGVEVKTGLWVLFKMESHNHPSQIEPKSGAATGIGGIVRDILAMGARPIALVDTLRFAEPSDLKARYIFTGVVEGISWYGNCLAPEETVIARIKGQVKILSIGDFCESVLMGQTNCEVTEVLSFNPITLKPCWVRVLRVFRRNADRLLEIRTSMGRRLKLTKDHPCLVLGEKGWTIKSAQQLLIGDRLPVICLLPIEPNSPRHLDLNAKRMSKWFSRAINSHIQKSLKRYTNLHHSYPRHKWHGDFATVKVVDVQEILGSTVYDLEVENTHLFVTSGGIVTHNCIGIPTVAGEVGFNDCYKTNCLVGVMCIGVAWEKELMTGEAKGFGNAVIYVGNATGRDGIGGCSILASKEMREELEMRPTVQLGDPFAEKCLIEACLEAFRTKAVVAVKDMGAAGLTCATVEMAAAGNVGMVVDLSLVPKREPDMQAWELMMSESQERMLLVVQKGREEDVKRIFDKWGLNCAVIGSITDDGMVRIYEGEKLVAEIPAKDIAEAPIKKLTMQKPEYLEQVKRFDFSQLPEPDDYTEALLHLLSSPNISSKAWVYQQYDHMVQVNTVVLPGAADAAVLRLKDWDERLGIAVTADCNSVYCYLNPYWGAQLAVAEAARNLSCVGSEPAGVTDCLCFGNPDKPDRYWQFVESVKGIADACRELNIPVVSGNVSFYNESEISVIHPSPLIGMVGVLEDVSRHATMAFKDEGDLIVLLSICGGELGGSEYLRWRFGLEVGEPPKLNWRLEKAVQVVCQEGIRQGIIKSAHDCSEGGLAICLAECCIAGEIGGIVNLTTEMVGGKVGKGFSAILFGETASRIVVTVASSALSQLNAVAKEYNCPMFVLGKVGGKDLAIAFEGKELIREEVRNLQVVWSKALAQQIGS